MKKCVCISCFDYYSTRMEGIIKFFEEHNCDIAYFYADYDHFAKKENENTYRYGKAIKVVHYDKNLSFSRLYSHFQFSKKVMKQVIDFQPDFIYCVIPPNYLLKELSSYKKANPNVKLVYDIYDLWPESFPYSSKKRFLKIPFAIWGRLRSKNISRSDLIVCVSQQGKDSLLKEVGDTPVKVFKPVILPGEMPEYKSNTRELSFCYLGMVNHITDMDLGEQLLSCIAKKRRTVLHIIGEGRNLSEFVQRLEKHGVEVICHGCIFDRKKKNEVLSMCNMGLNIPREEIDSTMSLKAIEYLRAGIPFINNAKGDIRSIVSEDRVGINIDNNIEHIVEMVLNAGEGFYAEMHNNCITSYEKRFLNQNYAEMFGELMEK